MIQNMDIVDKKKFRKYKLQDRINMYIDFYTTLLNYKKKIFTELGKFSYF